MYSILSGKSSVGLVIVLLLCPLNQAQTPNDKQSAPSKTNRIYSDNASGLRQLVEDMLTTAKSDDPTELLALIRQTEIPDYENWYTTTFGKEKGESWAEPYGKMLDEHEKEFQDHLRHLAHQDGKVSVQKIDARGRYDTLTGRLDLFLADWKGDDNHSKVDHIGYFMFIEGKFRWDSTVEFMEIHPVSELPAARENTASESTVDRSLPSPGGDPNTEVFQAGKNGVGYPSCAYCPDPELTVEAKNAKFRGTVVLLAIIGPDGTATNIEVAKSPGLGLDQKALEVVRGWRFKPAIGPHGKPVAVRIPIEVTFR